MEDDKKKVWPPTKKQYVGFMGTIGTVYAFGTGLVTSEAVMNVLSNVAHNQIAQAGFCFIVSDWIRAVRQKKEFTKLQGEVLASVDSFAASMRQSLQEVAEALRLDLASKASRQEVQAGFDKLHGRIDALETRGKQ
jgi:hypothetical protein